MALEPPFILTLSFAKVLAEYRHNLITQCQNKYEAGLADKPFRPTSSEHFRAFVGFQYRADQDVGKTALRFLSDYKSTKDSRSAEQIIDTLHIMLAIRSSRLENVWTQTRSVSGCVSTQG